MLYFTAVIVALGIIWLVLKAVNVRAASRRLEKGMELEERGDYKSACFEYALAIAGGCRAQTRCAERIRAIWIKYGPFDYEDRKKGIEKEREEVSSDTTRDRYGCEAGGLSIALADYLDATEVINQVVAGKTDIKVQRRRVIGSGTVVRY